MAAHSTLAVVISLSCLSLLVECQFRRVGRRGGRRRGREEVGGGYAAPADGYSAGDVPVYGSGDVPVYGASDAVPTYSAASPADAALEALGNSIPGVPGEDYPIYAEVPESAFLCDGQVDGGYYADPEAECQAFHICTADGAGGLAKYSFLCPNGTLFNQNYFICDWWFNFDCSTAEELYSLNDEIAAERDALAGAADDLGAYGAPAEYAAGSGDAPVYEGGAPARRGRGRRLGSRRNSRRPSGARGGRRSGRRG